MVGKYFLLAFVCISLGQVLGDELENAILKGLTKANILFERGVRRIENLEKFQTDLIDHKANAFCDSICRLLENSKLTLRKGVEASEVKAKELDKATTVFECIRRAEKSANNQIEVSVKKFAPIMERMKKINSRKIEFASTVAPEMKQEFEKKYKNVRIEIKASTSTKYVEIAVNGFSFYTEKFFDDVGDVENQMNCILKKFEKDVRGVFNSISRQICATQAAGLRQIKACVYRKNQFIQRQ